MLEAALTWSPDSRGVKQAARRIERSGQDPDLARDLTARLTEDVASSLTVTYPQYGGLTVQPSTASVMVIAQQRLRRAAGETPREEGFSCDVRLRKVGAVWKVERVLVGKAPAPGRPSEAVEALLANKNVVLPEAARADLLSGQVDERVMALLSTLSRDWKLHVQVLRTGHPRNVFGTSRLSNHTRGRAVDIWALDDRPIIDQARTPWRAVMRAAAKAGADEIGGPGIPTGGSGLFFTDAVHQDHVHLAFGSRGMK